MSEPIRKAYSREEIITEARAYMVKSFGAPQDSGDSHRWYERLGMLADFLSDRFPSNESGGK